MDFRAEFTAEARDLLREIASAVNALYEGAEPQAREGLWAVILRNLHTIKGAASMVGEGPDLAALSREAHDIEDFLTPFAHDNAALIDLLAEEAFRAVESLELCLNAVERGDEPAVDAAEGLASPAASSVEAPPNPALSLASPSASSVELAPVSPTHGASKPEQGEQSAYLRVRMDRVDVLGERVGDLVLSQLRQAEFVRDLQHLRDDISGLNHAWRQAINLLRQYTLDRALNERLDDINEGLRRLARDSFSTARAAHLATRQSSQVVTALSNQVRDLRMMPIKPFFESFSSVLTEAGRLADKRVRLVAEGAGVEIGRMVLEPLRPVLVHLVRNAVGHGIEDAATRADLGKRPIGMIRLGATARGGQVRIIIEDDGAGINLVGVRAKALALGLIREDQPVTPHNVLEILTRPGFSVKDEADALSGRGVGMDVVADTIRQLGGALSLETNPGAGSRFFLDVPISASTTQGLVVRVGERRFAFPLDVVERVVRLTLEDLHQLEGRAIVRVGQGPPLSLTRLGDLLGVPHDERAAKIPAVVIQSGASQVAIEVDEIIDASDLVIKPMPEAFQRQEVFSGGAVQADHALVLVLQAAALLARAHLPPQKIKPNVLLLPPDKVSDQRCILVVDDSLTMRTLERNILQQAGYQVLSAEDGRVALERFEGERRVDLIVSDYEMPHMDGLDLCRAVRASERPNTPFIVISAVTDAARIQRMLDAGADTFIPKGEFEESRLLKTVENFIGS
ncbi:response regulator [Myxococcota bacterium]|nr:response regulator [Myxococcota bacterium]